jgi:hypothetical protein
MRHGDDHLQLRGMARLVTLGVLSCASGLMGGCALGQLAGGMAASAERTGTKDVKAKYAGLDGKSFAVVVAADRAIQVDHPGEVILLTREIARRLSEETEASGWVPPDKVLAFQSRRPGWVAMSPAALAKELGVERLVFVDLSEFALHEPGNPHVWAGAAAGSISVIEADGEFPDESAFKESIRVSFPDSDGLGPQQVEECGLHSASDSSTVPHGCSTTTKSRTPSSIDA